MTSLQEMRRREFAIRNKGGKENYIGCSIVCKNGINCSYQVDSMSSSKMEGSASLFYNGKFARFNTDGAEEDFIINVASHKDKRIMIDVDHVTIRFNKANQKIDNLKDYAIKFVKRELMFQEFLALRDITFQVRKGEGWGLIGTNGSGKSTMLKAIAGIMKPYKGKITTSGSIAPLIELGAGFDSNLTARENIYLNGAVLGYSKQFMKEHFQEIVEFADIRSYLDSPIKNYSSGMKARLGFSVATVVNPDILIVDEVLSVGDAKFRKKCNQRMEELLGNETTLLYVSHNIKSVLKLCTHALWIDKGHAVMQGRVEEVCEKYMESQGLSMED